MQNSIYKIKKKVKKIKIKKLIEELEKLDPEGSIYCFDYDNKQYYAISGLPIHNGAEIFHIPIKKTKKSE
ncbi:MAG: hypothetical protein ACFE8N_08775 [Promethearchaeota archaeon]